MKKFSLALLATATALAIAPAAMATPVEFSTSPTGFVSPTSGSGSAVYFMGVTDSNVNAPTFASLGTFYLTGLTASFTDVAFTLDITQIDPTSGSGSLSSDIDGKVSYENSTATITFDEPSVTIGAITYALTEETYTLNANTGLGAGNYGQTTIEAEITATPEPSSLVLLGTGLLGLAFVAFRKTRSTGMALSM
jgi:hypothetical protein